MWTEGNKFLFSINCVIKEFIIKDKNLQILTYEGLEPENWDQPIN